MKKLLLLSGVGLLVVMLNGCGEKGPTSNPVPSGIAISIDGIGLVVIGGAAGHVTGTIESDSIITGVTMKVLTAADGDVSSDFTISFTPGYSGKTAVDLAADLHTSVAAKSTVAAATYKLEITVTAGSKTNSRSREFAVTDGNTGTPVTIAEVTMGSFANTTDGSSIDLDDGSVYLTAEACAEGSGTDLVGTYSSDLATMRIFTPVYARDFSKINAFIGWKQPAATSIVKVTGTAFGAITTVGQLFALYSAGTPGIAWSCATGDVFVVKTDLNRYVAIEIGVFAASTSGTFKMKYAK